MTPLQQTALKEFFVSYSETLRNRIEGDDIELDTMYENDAIIADTIVAGNILTHKDFYWAVKGFDDYDDVLEYLGEDNEDLVELFYNIREMEIV